MYDGGKHTKITMGDYVFDVREFAPFHAMGVLGELQKIIAPALGGAVQGVKAQGLEADVSNIVVMGSLVSDMLNKIAETTDGEKLQKAAKLLLDPEYISVSPKGKKDFVQLDEDAINEIFSGRVVDMFVLMAKIFKVNFLDFSRLSSVPIGFRKRLGEIKTSLFQVKQAQSLET